MAGARDYDAIDGSSAPARKRHGAMVVGAMMLLSGAAVATSRRQALRGAERFSEIGDNLAPAAPELTTTEVVVHAYADAMWPDCRRHALTLHEYMLNDDEMMSAITLKVDLLGTASSIAEHGTMLVPVNKYELCAEHNSSLTQKEWWGFQQCMYGLQACLSVDAGANNSTMTCTEAEAGTDDDMTIAGTDTIDASDDCTCTLAGVADYCATKHTSTTFADLQACAESDYADSLFNSSSDRAAAANSGSPLWVTVNGLSYVVDGTETADSLSIWVSTVKAAVCNELEAVGLMDSVSSCEDIMEDTLVVDPQTPEEVQEAGGTDAAPPAAPPS